MARLVFAMIFSIPIFGCMIDDIKFWVSALIGMAIVLWVAHSNEDFP